VSLTSGTLAEFIRARRAQVGPADVGLPVAAGRRVSGLRRSEVAALAHISVQYLTRLEQGRTHQPSETVLSGLVTALALDEHAAAYLYRLALPAPPTAAVPKRAPVSELVEEVVSRWSHVPVHVVDRNQDVVLSNELAQTMFPSLLSAGNNIVLSVFAASRQDREREAWTSVARQAVAALRYHGDPADPRLRHIVGALSAGDPEFRTLWAEHHARPLDSGVVLATVEGFGRGPFPWQMLEIPGGYFMVVYLAVAGEFSGDAVEYLRTSLDAGRPPSGGPATSPVA
jgi:transcriptional regulator with XRE-family HTH domain